MSAYLTTIQYIIGVLARVLREEKEVESTQFEKEEVKWSVFADDMIQYVANPKDPTKKNQKQNKQKQTNP